MLNYINVICVIFLWAYSSMDRMTGFGPVDRGSNPRTPVMDSNQVSITQDYENTPKEGINL